MFISQPAVSQAIKHLETEPECPAVQPYFQGSPADPRGGSAL
ncbi:MAG: LysR family transcriptional regulator [Acutalibacteraceae bacterium]